MIGRRTFLRASAMSVGGMAATVPAACAPAATSVGPLRVQILMFDGVEEQDFVAPAEVFGLASAMGGEVTSTMVTAGDPGMLTCAYGTRVEVPTGWSPDDADVLVVPGGGYTDQNGPGVHRLIANERFLGATLAQRAETVLEYERRGTVWRP